MQAATSIEYTRKQNIISAFLKIYQNEGLRGLYRVSNRK